MFSDEANFYVNPEANQQQTAGSCSHYGLDFIVLYFFDRTVISENYLAILGNSLMSELDTIGSCSQWYM